MLKIWYFQSITFCVFCQYFYEKQIKFMFYIYIFSVSFHLRLGEILVWIDRHTTVSTECILRWQRFIYIIATSCHYCEGFSHRELSLLTTRVHILLQTYLCRHNRRVIWGLLASQHIFASFTSVYFTDDNMKTLVS